MWNRLQTKLSSKLAMQLGAIAIVFILVSAWIFYERTATHQRSYAYEQLHQVIETVSTTASIAAFVGDDVLAKEVVTGLVGNDLIAAAEIKTDQEVLYTTDNFVPAKTVPLTQHKLLSPFDSTLIVGTLNVQADESVIQAHARVLAEQQAIHIVLNALLMIVMLIVLFRRQVINGINSMAAHLHRIRPGSSERLPHLISHSRDELGMLVTDINHLLDSVETQLENERALRHEVENLEKRFRNIFENTSGGIALVDQKGHVQLHNPAFEKMLGPALIARLTHAPKDSLFRLFGLANKNLTDVFHKSITADAPLSTDVRIEKYNQTVWVHCLLTVVSEQKASPVYEVMIQDISERREREESFKFQAEMDPLTGLYNRRGGEQKAQELFDASKGQQTQFAILMIDLDNFKPVNDQYGHDAGDAVLVAISERIRSVVRDDDVVIRWGGDEFLIVIKQSQKGTEASSVANKLQTVISEIIPLDGDVTASLGASIGIAIYPEHGTDLDILARHADEAMYKIKSGDKHGFSFYKN